MSRKLFITLILILFLLPFVSWYYLKSGLEWRKNAQAIMNGTTAFPEGEWIDSRGNKFSSDILDQHVTLITLIDCNTRHGIKEIVSQFYDQFKETNKANYIILDRCADKGVSIMDKLSVRTFHFTCADSVTLCQNLLVDWPAGKSHALIDRNKIIRSYYASVTKEEKRILLEHMALLLPRDRSEKVELKRGKEK